MNIIHPREIKENPLYSTPEQVLKLVRNDEYSLAYLLYYFKWLSRECQSIVQCQVVERFWKYNLDHRYNYPFSLRNYSESEKSIIAQNVWFFQLSFGCTHGCAFCWSDAPYFKKPLSLPFGHIIFLLKKFRENFILNYTFFYWASDPLDYRSGKKSYDHIVKACRKLLGKSPFTSSALNTNNLEIFQKIKKFKIRLSALWSNKNLFEQYKSESSFESNEIVMHNGLSWYLKKKFDYGILCLNWVLLTPFFAYNLVNIKDCNSYFPQGLLAYPITEITQEPILVWANLILYLSTKVVMYDYVEKRSKVGHFNKIVVFLRDKNTIYITVCSKEWMGSGFIEILFSRKISHELYHQLVFTKEWYNMLYNIEYNEAKFE